MAFFVGLICLFPPDKPHLKYFENIYLYMCKRILYHIMITDSAVVAPSDLCCYLNAREDVGPASNDYYFLNNVRYGMLL